ncbi:hypothetical protein J2X46_002694 [Nocardioides sp. BE266]|uniref:hypothetical protein n=1 Tax=Nocardioides sp. BE266 TaxID=2817725 RepID=UPI002860AA77|nr:hypothetical protein [Nocardioides sp. BE266]MDR7253704.1 hypothetical protein [Nocardioides sp. BE266]
MATRRERVVLDLESNLPAGMLRGAAATEILRKELDRLSGVSVQTSRASANISRDIDKVDSSAKRADQSINQLTGRLRLFADAAAILGPALAPLGGVAIAGMAGLASQMGFAAVAGGVLIGSLQGVGDALGKMNDAQLDPTKKNLEEAEDALKRLSPAAREFAKAAFDLKPALVAIRDMGAEALMPGLTESLDSLERVGPRVAAIMTAVSGALGEIASDSAASLASDRWAGFFEFIENEAPQAIAELATTVGSLTHGMAELWQAFTPINDGFSSWLMDVAAGFDSWATGLSATEGFAEFVDYIRTTGPQVADTLGALANAVIQVVQATAPLGGPVLAAVEAFSNAIAAIADSDLGTPIFAAVAALSLLNRTLAVTKSLSSASLSSGLFSGLGTASKGIKGQANSIRSDIAAMSDTMVAFGTNTEKAGQAAERMKSRLAKGAGLAGFAVAATGAADAIGLTNTTSLALMGTLVPGGVVIGAAAGLLLDLRSAGMGATAAIQGLDAAVQSGDVGVLSEQIAAAKAELTDIKNLDFNAGDILDRIGFSVADTFGGPSMDDARAKIEASERALYELTQAQKLSEVRAKGAALALLQQTGANVDLAKWSGKTKEEIKAQADAINTMREEADKTARSFVGLGDSLNDGKVSLAQWIKDMASTADALNNFTTNSQKAARLGLEDGLIRSLQAAGEEGALRMRQLANGTQGEIERANAAFLKGEKAIERYNNYKIPPKKITADASRAMQSFREVDQYLSSLNGKTATTYVNTVRTVTGPQGAAAFSQQAFGDFKDRHHPEIASGRTMRVWAEPETQGESYIPHANDSRRPRAKSILEQTAAMFGGSVQWFAEGGTTGKKGSKPKASGGAFVYDNTAALEQAIDRLTGKFDRQSEIAERDIKSRDEWAQKMADVAQATVAGFNTGLFEKSSNPWAAGATGGALGNVNRDIAGLQQRGAIQQQLAAMGITGNALATILAEGDNQQISALIASGQAQATAAAIDQRSALQASVGAAGGQAAFGQQFAYASQRADATLAEAQQTNAQLAGVNGRLERVEKAIAAASDRTGDRVAGAVSGPATRAVKSNANGKPVKPR